MLGGIQQLDLCLSVVRMQKSTNKEEPTDWVPWEHCWIFDWQMLHFVSNWVQHWSKWPPSRGKEGAQECWLSQDSTTLNPSPTHQTSSSPLVGLWYKWWKWFQNCLQKKMERTHWKSSQGCGHGERQVQKAPIHVVGWIRLWLPIWLVACNWSDDMIFWHVEKVRLMVEGMYPDHMLWMRAWNILTFQKLQIA